jgi:hypothetical protein
MKLLYIIAYVSLMVSLSTSLSGCGDGAHIDTLSSNCAQPVVNSYEACLSRNTNYCGSPAWFYWVNQCKLRFGVNNPYIPSCPYVSSQPDSIVR